MLFNSIPSAFFANLIRKWINAVATEQVAMSLVKLEAPTMKNTCCIKQAYLSRTASNCY